MFLYIAITVVIAAIVLGVSRALWPLEDEVIEGMRALVVLMLSAMWPVTLPLVIMAIVI